MSKVSKQSVIRTYGRYAPIYDVLFGAIQRTGCRKMADVVSSLEAMRVLEVGVGTGLTLKLYPEATHITGIDLSAEMLEHARLRATSLPKHCITLEVMDAEKMQFEDNAFDCVTVPYVLSVTPNPDQLTTEIRRVCRPGGHILIVNHFSGSRIWWLAERLVRSVADRIGFRSDFDYSHHILQQDWTVLSTRPVSLFGLYRLVVIRND
ncbi:phosphatidylethanolamine/phosphatidyl-N-methylethanolamine N-methyltransferase [Pseudoxanthomonas japonensis]|uniref:class I SAM-dependent methyltransferase n=1 Tax=Pseudoxanthomonas TaxID=83618 RepID=UPI0007864843|nr:MULTISPECIES: methyltransferase domain-containing protein [Pseudoxanthomonas]MDR7069568.1 phosphatidylethanolamine/phosphatidyl-N-methylethanolamine N-methyltransferase [Pseudoxanthomonas japonensis]